MSCRGLAWGAHTGEVRWQERLGGRDRASLLVAEGRLYAVGECGAPRAATRQN